MIARCFIPNPNNYQEIDHIDGNKLNNNIWNIRWVNRSENARNRENYSHKKEGRLEKRFKYVYWHVIDKKWTGKIKINGKQKHISSGNNDEEIYIKCLQKLSDISTNEELLYYNKQVLDDMIKYEIIWIITPDDLIKY